MVTALKIPKKYFAGTGIGTGFCRVRGGRDRDEKTRSRRTLLTVYGSYHLHEKLFFCQCPDMFLVLEKIFKMIIFFSDEKTLLEKACVIPTYK